MKEDNMGFLSAVFGNASEVSAEDVLEKYALLLTAGEEIIKVCKLFRDVYIFTDKRLILIDKQGVSGKKTEYLTIPYRSISRFSVETAGHFDLDAELKIWISSAAEPAVVKTFSKSVNIYEIQRILAKYVL